VRYHATVSETDDALQAQAERHRQAAEAAEAATEWQQAVDEYEACLRLGLLDDAERHYREGLAWCEQERLPRDAEQCRAGLADVAARR